MAFKQVLGEDTGLYDPTQVGIGAQSWTLSASVCVKVSFGKGSEGKRKDEEGENDEGRRDMKERRKKERRE